MSTHSYAWVIAEATLVTPVTRDYALAGAGPREILVKRYGRNGTGTADAVVVGYADNEILLNGVRVELGDDFIAFVSLLDEAYAVALVGQSYRSEPYAD